MAYTYTYVFMNEFILDCVECTVLLKDMLEGVSHVAIKPSLVVVYSYKDLRVRSDLSSHNSK